MKWDEDAWNKLLYAIVATNEDNIKIDNQAIADIMGDGCTAKAVSHKVGKVRAKARQIASDANAATPTTPVANSDDAAATGGGGSTSNKKKRKNASPAAKDGAADAEDDGNDGDQGDCRASKRQKAASKAGGKNVA